MKRHLFKRLVNSYYFFLDKISHFRYEKKYPKYLRWLGINAEDGCGWIHPKTFFDASGYNLISIGKGTIISFGVKILVHDTSIVPASKFLGKKMPSKVISKEVKIGRNCFIGADTIILPGTTIQDGVIVGAGSVVRGNLEKGCIYIGNPATKVSTVDKFIEKHGELFCTKETDK